MQAETFWDSASLDYYDESAHPVIARLGEASTGLTIDWFSRHQSLPQPIVELGAGRALLDRLPNIAGLGVIAVDRSRGMLQHTPSSIPRVLGDAEHLPFAPDSLGLVLALLGAPFNTLASWNEIARCLRPAGFVLVTYPDYDWALHDRGDSSDQGLSTVARYGSGGTQAPFVSIVRSSDEQHRLITMTGLAVVEEASCESRHGDVAAVATLIVARKGAK